MDVFPADASFFRGANYWSNFYSNPKLSDFDWYGSMDDFLGTFNRCLASKVPFDAALGFDTNPAHAVVINVGCGNSMLPFKLFELGYTTIYNIDFCSKVLDEMRAKDHKGSMNWLQIDVSKDAYGDLGSYICNKFQGRPKVVIDKAFLDAYVSVGEGESLDVVRERAKSYIGTTLSFMAGDDVFLIFSLAQDYVVAELVRNLLFKDVYLDIYPLYKSDASKAHLVQFLFVIYKRPAGSSCDKPSVRRKQCLMAELPNLPFEEFEVGSLPKRIRVAKGALYLAPNIQEYSPGRRLTFDIYPKDLQSQVCFTAALYDCVNAGNAQIYTAAIIVPTGQEHFWQYSCSEGNEELACQASARRVIILWLKFSSSGNSSLANKGIVNPFDACFGDEALMSYIRDYMSDILLKLSLNGTDHVTILKAGESSAIRAPRRVGSSMYAGDIVIHEILGESDCPLVQSGEVVIRQMVFSCSPQTVQSEIRCYVDEEGQTRFLDDRAPNEYLTAIILAMAFLPEGKGILSILGSGSGTLPTLLRRLFETREIHAVEIDDIVTELARTYFGYSPDAATRLEGRRLEPYTGEGGRLLQVSGDAADYIDYVSTGNHDIACFVIDINNVLDGAANDAGEVSQLSKQLLMSPHPQFLGTEILESIVCVLKKSNGVLIVNVLARSDTVLERVLSRLSTKFAWVGVLRMPSDINKVVVCLVHPTQDASTKFCEFVTKLSRGSDLDLIASAEDWKSSLSVF